MSEQQSVSIESRDRALLAVVNLTSLDEDHTRRMQEEVARAAAAARHLPVVLDLSRVEFVPSLSLGALVTLLQECRQHNQRFVLAGMQPPVRESLAITRLDKLFEICESVDDALAG